MATALRDYQDAAVASVREHWATTIDGRRPRVCLVAPTGAGKTVMAEALLAKAKMPLVVVHTRVLAKQSARRIPNAMVTTVQALLADGAGGDRRRGRLARHDMVFFDECHHLGGEEWRAVIQLLEHAHIFGCTATPERADGTPLGDVFDRMVIAAQYTRLLADGHLCKCDVLRSEVKRSTQKKNKVRPDGVAAYLEVGKREDGRWRPGIFFDSTIALCTDAVAAFEKAGLRARLVCCDTGDEERQATFDAYNAGELDMLASPMALSEGFDAPRAEVCVLRRSCEHVGTYLQIVGRVLRPHPDKERALLIDITGASTLHGLPTDDRVYSLDGKGIGAVPEPEEEEELKEVIERQGYEVVESKYQLIRDTLRDRFLDLVERQKEYGYKDGWLWHRFKEATGVEPPRRFTSKYRSTCQHCKHKLQVGQSFLWVGSGKAYHEDCWFDSLDQERLDAAHYHMNPSAPIPAPKLEDNTDDIPF